MAQPADSAAPEVAPHKSSNPILRGIYFALGLLCLALISHSYLPGIPTFDLVILAVAISASIGISGIFLIDNTVVGVILALVWVYAIWFVFTRSTRPASVTV